MYIICVCCAHLELKRREKEQVNDSSKYTVLEYVCNEYVIRNVDKYIELSLQKKTDKKKIILLRIKEKKNLMHVNCTWGT